MYVSIIIPAYNEEKRLPNTLKEIDKYMSGQNFVPHQKIGDGVQYEIIVVVDGAKDKTAESAQALIPQIKNLRVIDNKKNHGKGYVVRQGMLEAKGKYRIFTDADNSTSIDQIEKMFPEFEKGAEVVIGSRDIKGAILDPPQSASRVFVGNVFNLIVQIISGLFGIWDTQCGFKGFTEKSCKDIFSKCKIDRFAFDVEVLVLAKKMGYKIKEIPITWKNDLLSTVGIKSMFKMLIEVFQIRWNLIIHKYDQNNNSKSFTQPHFSRKSGAGFTIIELLVVIAIIGLISSVVLVSMKGSTGKAKIAKGLEFSQTIMNTIGHDAVGVWNFDEGSGGTAHDKSGYKNHGTITGATWVSGEENTPHWFVDRGEGRSALKFDGSGDRVSLSKFITINHTQSFTIEYWVKAQSWNAPYGQGAGIYTKSDDTWDSCMNIDEDAIRMQDIPGASYLIAYIFNLNQWYHVTIVFTTTDIKLYVNGKYEGSTGHLNNDVQFNHIGRGYAGVALDGFLDEVRIYERALGSSEIEQHYAGGAEKHEVALK